MKLSFSVVLVCLALWGCAATNGPAQNPEQLRATHGFVRVTLPLRTAQSKVVFKAVNGGAEYELRRDNQLGPDVFGSWLPAGEYQVAELSNPDGSKYLPVQVKAGQLTEMGGLVPIQLGGYEFVLLPIRHPEIAADSAHAVEHLSPYLSTRQSVDWRPRLVPKASRNDAGPTGLGLVADLLMEYERHVNKPALNQQLKQQSSISAMYELALTALPPQIEEPAVGDGGNLYFGAELGQLRVRGSDGRWSNVDTGTLEAITAVAAAGSRLVVGTARGAIRASEDGGQHWKQIAGVNSGEAVLDIDRLGSRWLVMAARLTPLSFTSPVLTTEQLIIYTTTSDDLTGLSMLRQVKLPDRQLLIQSWTPKGQVSGQYYYVNGVSEVLRLDASSMQWAALKLPHDATTVNVSKRSGVLTATLIKGAFSKLHVSTDNGASWLRRDNPSYPIYDVNFDSPELGQATRWNTGAFSSTIEFVRYDPSKDAWQKAHEAPAGCVRILRDADRTQRYCLTSGGTILNFVEGRWVVEFAVN